MCVHVCACVCACVHVLCTVLCVRARALARLRLLVCLCVRARVCVRVKKYPRYAEVYDIVSNATYEYSKRDLLTLAYLRVSLQKDMADMVRHVALLASALSPLLRV